MMENIKDRLAGLERGNSERCCSKNGISIGTIAGIALGALIGIPFDQTLNGMIIGFSIGMGVGAVVDVIRKR